MCHTEFKFGERARVKIEALYGTALREVEFRYCAYECCVSLEFVLGGPDDRVDFALKAARMDCSSEGNEKRLGCLNGNGTEAKTGALSFTEQWR